RGSLSLIGPGKIAKAGGPVPPGKGWMMTKGEAGCSAGVQAVTVLYADARLAVVDKPAGLLVHDSRLAGGESDFLVDRLRVQFGRRVFPAHRLDRATSGCLLVAFDSATAAALGEQLMSRTVEKDYLAVCRGWPAAAFTVDH